MRCVHGPIKMPARSERTASKIFRTFSSLADLNVNSIVFSPWRIVKAVMPQVARLSRLRTLAASSGVKPKGDSRTSTMQQGSSGFLVQEQEQGQEEQSREKRRFMRNMGRSVRNG